VSVVLSVVIMAHPKRERLVNRLLTRLDAKPKVVWDDGTNNRWVTGRRALLAHNKRATHHLVIQDDAIVPVDLIAGVTRALAFIPPRSPMCLYAGSTGKFWRAVENNRMSVPDSTSWLLMNQLHWGVAIAFPTPLIKPMVTWCDQLTHVDNWDKRLSRWTERHNVRVWYPWPSLVDHDIRTPSLVPGRGTKGRRAKRFIGATARSVDFDVSGGIVDLRGVHADPETLPRSKRRDPV